MITRRVLDMVIFACEINSKSIRGRNTCKAQHFRACQTDGVIGPWSFSALLARVGFSWRANKDVNGRPVIADSWIIALKLCYAHARRFHSIASTKACTAVLNMLIDKCQLFNHHHTETAGIDNANRRNRLPIGFSADTGRHRPSLVEQSQ